MCTGIFTHGEPASTERRNGRFRASSIPPLSPHLLGTIQVSVLLLCSATIHSRVGLHLPLIAHCLSSIPFHVLKLFQNKQRSSVLSPSSPQDGPKTKPGTSGTHRGPRGHVSVACVPGTSIWGSAVVLEVAQLQPKKNSPEMPEST